MAGRWVRVQATSGPTASSRVRPSSRQLVVDAWWHDGVDGAGEDTVTLEVAQRQGQHPLADAVDLALELTEAEHAVAEQLDDEERPLVGEPVEQLAQLTGGRVGGCGKVVGS